MAAVHSVETPARLNRRSTAPAVPKLRDTCDACAASKVKCSKEKPTCARCAKRGVICEYVVTRRSGRKHGPRHSDTTTTTQASSSSSSDENALSMPETVQTSPRLRTIGDTDGSPTMLSPGDPASWWMFMELSPEFNEFFASPTSFQTPEASASYTTGQPVLVSQAGNDGVNSWPDSNDARALDHEDALVIMNDILEAPTLSMPLSLPESQSMLPSEALGFQNSRSDGSCCCLLRAIGLLNWLFRNWPTACVCSKGQEPSHTTCQLPTVQSVFAENERTITAINNMLQCLCSQDGYLLAIMALIVFKVLGWYAAAAKAMPEGETTEEIENRCISLCHPERVQQCPTVVDSYCLDGEDQGRMAAQQVLSELHHVQKLVNELSSRLKAADSQDKMRKVDVTSPFSSTMLNQLGADLRTRLRTLSSEIVDMLRRG